MGKKDEDEEDFDLADLFDSHFDKIKKRPQKKETPLERYRRTGKKLPPPNNPHTKAGRAWIAAYQKKLEARRKKEEAEQIKKGGKQVPPSSSSSED